MKETLTASQNNEEKYISFSKDVVVDTDKDGKDIKQQLRFIDIFKFMASSVDKLVSNLNKGCCVNTSKYYRGEQLSLLLRKRVYLYDYMNSPKRLDEAQLPPKEAFYSKLSGEDISNEDYKHAERVWKEFGMTLSYYHDLYDVSEVLLLPDVLENFRDVCSNNSNPDLAWYYTAPPLMQGWFGMLP